MEKCENRNIKVSIIVPIYNSQKNIARCLDHLVNQTLKEIEIINPYIIVCGGKRGTLNNLSIKHEKIINDYHPASSRHNSDINDQLRMLELQ